MSGRRFCFKEQVLAGGEEVAYPIHPRFCAWIVVASIHFVQLVEFAQQFFLAFVEVDRGFNHDMAQQIAVAVAPNSFDALAAQAEGFP